ncbi:Hint domain-containing protein [Falsirhodobacter deserti]|uniref:Hint domain-containing protein n=1 Tax=Falsirhodobacter deserti TaxID=1365611 RepID=UPI0013E2BE05|nr:Hint domain-containing protein [Falsirhodobacter deserti]
MVQATQLPVDTSADATQLAQTMFGKGITVVSATYEGDAASKGIYTQGQTVSPGSTPSDSGIILSTGHASKFTNAGGDNANQQAGTSTNTAGVDGNPALDQIAGLDTFDGAILNATFIPDGSTMTMQLVFSSEEYPEYVNGGFNDAVGIFVNGQKVQLSIGSGDISIDNITDGGTNGVPSNENLYLDNSQSQYNTEMDGLTITLTLKAPVNPGVENTISIGIADAGDASYDSNLLIAANSVQTEVIAYADAISVGRSNTKNLDVLQNDTVGEGGTLTITEINGQPVNPGDSVTLVSGTIVTLNADGSLGFQPGGTLGEETFSYEISDQSGTTDVAFATINVTCFTRGTLIETDRGAVPIETLRVGDTVRTLDKGCQAIRWIGSNRLENDDLRQNPKLLPIRIVAGALGKATPKTDLVVSPQHRILVRSAIAHRMFGAAEVLVAAKQLLMVDGVDVVHDCTGVEYFHFLLDGHAIVYSNGAETETLFTGPEALKAVSADARLEILTLFPELEVEGFIAEAARPIASGRMGRKLASRHIENGRMLVA